MEHVVLIGREQHDDVTGALTGKRVYFVQPADIKGFTQNGNGSLPGILLDTRGMDDSAIAQIVQDIHGRFHTSPVIVHEHNTPPAGGNAYVTARQIGDRLLSVLHTHIEHRTLLARQNGTSNH